MSTVHTHERDPLAPVREGEFQRIPGIGPGIAQRLHAAGIQTFRHLASLTPGEIYAQLNGLVGLTPERIETQDWPGKAYQLARETAAVEPLSEPEDPGERQHYASFMVQLLQDENNAVRRTRVVNVQNGTKDGWAGWDAGQLAGWITSQAGIPEAPAAQETLMTNAQPLMTEKWSPAEVAGFELEAGEIFSADGEHPTRFLTSGEPFEIHMPLEIKTENRPRAGLLYQATLQARPVGGQYYQIAEVHGRCAEEGVMLLVIPAEGLGEGAYHLQTSVMVYPEGAAQPGKAGRYAFIESGLVYAFSRESVPSV